MKKFVTLLLIGGVVGSLVLSGCAQPAAQPAPEGEPSPTPAAEAVPPAEPASPTPAPEPEPEPAAETPEAMPSTGTIEVRVTDAPPDEEVTAILVTVSAVEIHRAVAEQEQEQEGEGEQNQEQEQEQQEQGEWLPLSIIEGAGSFDLLEIMGLEEVLAVEEIEAGKYTQIRLMVERVEVILGVGEPEEAKVPSGELKFVRPFDVVEGETTVLLFDFDAEKSVTVTGKGNITVKPVVKLTVKQGEAQQQGISEVSEEESQEIAEEFVEDSPTFVFDGIEDTLVLTDTLTLQCPYCWQFVFEFDSSHAGYGDRTGLTLAEVITPHQAVVTVEQGEVTDAVLDGEWDMLSQETL